MTIFIKRVVYLRKTNSPVQQLVQVTGKSIMLDVHICVVMHEDGEHAEGGTQQWSTN